MTSAAAAAILVGFGAAELFNHSQSANDFSLNVSSDRSPALDASVKLDVAKAEQAYVDAASDYLAQLELSEAALPLEARKVLHGNLVIADRAIREIKLAWKQQPNEIALAQKLMAAHERRLELLQQVAQLSFATQNGG
jgi:hypothetical protein